MTDAAVVDRLATALPPMSRPLRDPAVDVLYSVVVGGEGPRRGVRRYHVVYSGAARIARTPHLDVAADALESSLHTHVALRARRRTFIHAGVVGWRGQAIVMPGSYFSGKSRLVAALVRAGATYYSDEYAVLDDRGRVHPYALPIMFRGPAGQPRQPVETLGGRTGRRPLPVGLVVLTRYEPERSWRPRAASQGHAVLELLKHTLAGRRAPEHLLDLLSRTVADTPVLKGARGEAEAAAAGILDRVRPRGRRRRADPNGRDAAARRSAGDSRPAPLDSDSA